MSILKKNKPAQSGADKTLRMGTEPIPSLLLEFAIPSIVGMLINSCYNVISAIFLGQAVGEAGLAVTTAAFPVMIVFMSLGMLVGGGGNALCAIRLGQGNKKEAERVLGNTFSLGVIIAVLCAIVVTCPITMDALLIISSTTPEIYELTRGYIWILGMGAFFQVVGLGINNFIRSAGAPNRALLTMVAGAVSSIAFNYLFVMVLGWGVPGSAFATICGQAVACISVLWYFLFTPNVPFKLHKSNMPVDGSLVKEILILGLPGFLMQVATCVANILVNFQLVKYGAMAPIGAQGALASIGVVGKVAGIAVMPIVGISAAAQPLFGFNYGAGKIDRVRKTIFVASIFAVVVGTAIWAVTRIWPVEIVAAFGVADELMDLSIFALDVQMLLIPIVGVAIIAGNYFQSTGQPSKSIFLSLTRQVLYFIPAIIILPIVMPMIIPGLDGINALFATWPVTDALAVLTSVIFMYFELVRLGKLERGEIEDKYAGGGKRPGPGVPGGHGPKPADAPKPEDDPKDEQPAEVPAE